MLEQQRVEYLQAMGIQLWMPRSSVANAAESLWFAGDELSQANNSDSNTAHIKVGNAADLLSGVAGTLAKSHKDTPLANDSVSQSVQDKTSPQDSHTEALKGQSGAASSSERSVVSEKLPVEGSAPVEGATAPQKSGLIDLTPPKFTLYFALWPCGILWVSSNPFDQRDQTFHASVSYFLLRTSVPQASYSHFKWPYIEGSNEDQSTPVALRALTAQWDFMSSQGARVWVSVDDAALEWLSKVSSNPMHSVRNKGELFSLEGKKLLWQELKSLAVETVS